MWMSLVIKDTWLRFTAFAQIYLIKLTEYFIHIKLSRVKYYELVSLTTDLFLVRFKIIDNVEWEIKYKCYETTKLSFKMINQICEEWERQGNH